MQKNVVLAINPAINAPDQLHRNVRNAQLIRF